MFQYSTKAADSWGELALVHWVKACEPCAKPLGPSCFAAVFFFSSRRRHTRFDCDWSSDVCSSDLPGGGGPLVDYTISHNVADAQGVATATGFVTDGQQRLDFQVTGEPGSGLHNTIEIGRASCRERV